MINPGNKIVFFLLIAATTVALHQMEQQPLAASYQHAYVNQEAEISTSSHRHVKAQLSEDVFPIRLPSLSFSFLSDLAEASCSQFFIYPIAAILEKPSFPVVPALKNVFCHLVNINAP